MAVNYIDELTGLYNEKYIDDCITDYMIFNPSSRLVMIDLQRFKVINDTLGHEVGDMCLKYFAKTLQIVFPENNNVIARLHGDEFCILTTHNENELQEMFDFLSSRLEFAYISNVIPVRIAYNAGDAQIIYDYNKTKVIADYMMYYAKKNQNNYQPYDKTIYSKKIEEEFFQSKLDTLINSGNLSYTYRDIFNRKNNKSQYYQIYTKNDEGNSFLDKGNYSRISGSILSQQLDMYNLDNYILNISKSRKKGIILLDHKTLLRYEDILKKIEKLSDKEKAKIVLGVDLRNIDKRDRTSLINAIEELQKSNINILLDKVDDELPESIIERINTNLVRINNQFWKEAITNSKKNAVLKYKLKMLEEIDPTIITFFDFIDTEEEFQYLYNMMNDSSLLSGNYYCKEKKLELKKISSLENLY